MYFVSRGLIAFQKAWWLHASSYGALIIYVSKKWSLHSVMTGNQCRPPKALVIINESDQIQLLCVMLSRAELTPNQANHCDKCSTI